MPLPCGQASFGGRLTPSEVREGAAVGFYPAIYPLHCFIYFPGRMNRSQVGQSQFSPWKSRKMPATAMAAPRIARAEVLCLRAKKASGMIKIGLVECMVVATPILVCS